MTEAAERAEAGAGSDYIVVLRARSSARFVPEGGWELNLDAAGLGLGRARVRAYTRWVQDGPHQVPRELVVEVTGHAVSLDEAATKFSAIARPIANMIGFVTNVRVGPIEAHLAYDCDPNSEERQFLEVFLPDERGALAEGRIVRQQLLAAACPAFLALPAESARVGRALRQYELALREWYIGGEWLALSHLWMAVEALTEAVVRRTLIGRGITQKELAQSLGVATDDPDLDGVRSCASRFASKSSSLVIVTPTKPPRPQAMAWSTATSTWTRSRRMPLRAPTRRSTTCGVPSLSFSTYRAT